MDTGTELAIRAIIRALYNTEAINARQVRGIMSALKDAAGAALDRREPETAKMLASLCKGVHLDTAVTPPENA